MEVLNGHKQRTEMVNIADVAKGSVINNENLERNFNFGASKASKHSYLYTKYTVLEGIPSGDGHVVCKIMAGNCMISGGTVSPNARLF